MNLVVLFSLSFIIAFVLSVSITWLVVRIARRLGALDTPNLDRKIHDRPVPLLGGVALYSSFVVSIGLLYFFGWLSDDRLSLPLLWGIIAAGGVLVAVGSLDDRFRLPWWQQMAGPIIAILIMLFAGLEIPFISNPLGSSLIHLDELNVGSFTVPIGPALVFLWLIGMMYTTKLLDGVDGLTSSISFVATLVIFVVSLFWDRSGSTTSFLALALAGATLGFLIWNWYPAKIFLGEGGSVFLGFMLAVLAIISGGKIATALLVMGVPILDVVWIIGRRLRSHSKFFVGDSKHIHFRLLHAGMSQRQVVLFLSFISLLFGSVSFFFTTRVKIVALGVLIIFMLILAVLLVTRYEKRTT